MTQREKKLGLGLLTVIIAVVHFWGFKEWQKRRSDQESKVASLTTTIDSFELMGNSAASIEEEVSWVNEHEAPMMSFQDAQTELQNFLVSSSKGLGFSPIKQSLISKPEAVLGAEVDTSLYQRVKIQISARASEKQIYQWLVAIHKPQEMRILSYLKLSPPENSSDEINCQIIAEQFISNLQN